MSDNFEDLTDIATEAKSEFNLMDRLAGRPTRTSEVTVYLDEVNGAEHLDLTEKLAAAKRSSEDPEDYKELEARVRELAAEIHKSGITFHLRAIPEIVRKKADRDARKHLKIKGNVSAEQLNDYADQFTARMFRDSVDRWVDHETGTTHDKLTVDEAIGLKDLLPRGQYDKIDTAVSNLSLAAQISDAVTADADF